jgi:hypothetical protein
VIQESRRCFQEENNKYPDIQGQYMTPVMRSSTIVPGSLLISTVATVSTSVLVMEHILNICGFPIDSTMVEIFNQEGWTGIDFITMLTMREVDGLLSTNSNGSYKTKPTNLHLF